MKTSNLIHQVKKNSNPIRFIYFDVGGVLLEFEHIRTEIPQRFNLDRQHYDQFMASIAHDRSIGKLSGEELDALFAREFGSVFPSKYWSRAEFISSFRPITAMHGFVKELAKHYRLGLLTNVSREIYERTQQDFVQVLYPAVDFEIRIASFEEGVSKPDPEIYRRAIARTGLAANEILFIDDMSENIAAAQEAGMQGIVFETSKPDTMIQILREFLPT